MSRSYTYDAKARAYKVPVPPSMSVLGYVYRPNRVAAGMTASYARKPRQFDPRKSPDANSLRVRGTTAASRYLGYYLSRGSKVCPCCGQRTQKWVLNTSGHRRLMLLRQRRDARLQSIAQQENPA